MNKWYIIYEGLSYGPFTESFLGQLHMQGLVKDQTVLCKQGESHTIIYKEYFIQVPENKDIVENSETTEEETEIDQINSLPPDILSILEQEDKISQEQLPPMVLPNTSEEENHPATELPPVDLPPADSVSVEIENVSQDENHPVDLNNESLGEDIAVEAEAIPEPEEKVQEIEIIVKEKKRLPLVVKIIIGIFTFLLIVFLGLYFFLDTSDIDSPQKPIKSQSLYEDISFEKKFNSIEAFRAYQFLTGQSFGATY